MIPGFKSGDVVWKGRALRAETVCKASTLFRVAWDEGLMEIIRNGCSS